MRFSPSAFLFLIVAWLYNPIVAQEKSVEGNSTTNAVSIVSDSTVARNTQRKEFIPIEWVKLINDNENTLSFDQVRELNWSEIPPQKSPYIMSKNTVWLVIDLSIYKGLNSDYWFSLIGSVREVNLYYQTDGDWERVQTQLDNQSSSKSFYPVFDLPYSKIDAPIYVQLIEPVLPVIAIEKHNVAFNRQLKKTIFNSIVLGGLLIILLINLFQWVETREGIFGYYIGFILSLVVIILAFGGNNMIYLLGEVSPYSKSVVHLVAMFFLNLMASLYAISFLQLKKNIPLLYKILVSTILLFLIFYIYLIFNTSYISLIANTSIAITLCLIFIGGIVLLKRGHSYVTYYVVAYALFAFLHIAYIVFRKYDYTFPYTSPVLLSWAGFFIEALLLNISLNHKIGFEKKLAESQYQNSQNHLLSFQRNQNVLLEERVKERTHQLEDSNDELRKVQGDLKEANSEVRKRNRELNETIGVLKKAHSKLIESEKMASLGVLSAGIGHEINNPLNFIKGGISGLSKHIKPQIQRDTKTKRFINIVNEGVDRAASIVKSLSHFSRTSTRMNEECDINEILSNCLVILESKLKYKVKVHKDFTRSITRVKGNEGRLHQAFLNVLSNAEQAIPTNGEIVIKTAVNKGRVIVTISDNGLGIEKKYLNKIMDPFFTTKKPGEGTGLGLSITYKIIEDHSGKIKVESELRKGTSIKITLPWHLAMLDKTPLE